MSNENTKMQHEKVLAQGAVRPCALYSLLVSVKCKKSGAGKSPTLHILKMVFLLSRMKTNKVPFGVNEESHISIFTTNTGFWHCYFSACTFNSIKHYL